MASQSSIQAGGAWVSIGAVTTGLEKGLKSAQAKLTAFGASVAKIGVGLAGLGASITVPLVAAANEFANTGAALALASARLGIDAEPLSALQYAAEKAGVGAEALTGDLSKLEQMTGKLNAGNKAIAKIFGEIGVSADDLKGKDVATQLGIIANGLNKLPDAADKAMVARRLGLGNLIPLLNSGSAGIDQLTARARALGLTMDGETAKGGLRLKNALGDLADVGAKISETLGEAIAPVLEKSAALFTAAGVAVIGFVKTHKELIVTVFKVASVIGGIGTALVAVGGAFVAAGLAAGAIGSAIAGIAGVALPVLAAIFSPIGLIVAGVAAVGAAIAGTIVYFAGASSASQGFWEQMLSGIKNIAGFFGPVVESIVGGFHFVLDTFLPILDVMFGSWSGFTQGIKVAWDVAIDFLKIAWAGFAGYIFSSLSSIVGKIASTFGNYLPDAVKSALNGTQAWADKATAGTVVMAGNAMAEINKETAALSSQNLPKLSDILKKMFDLKLPPIPKFDPPKDPNGTPPGIPGGEGVRGTFSSRAATQLVTAGASKLEQIGQASLDVQNGILVHVKKLADGTIEAIKEASPNFQP